MSLKEVRDLEKKADSLVPNDIAFRVQDDGARSELWEKLWDIAHYLDLPVNKALAVIVVSWHEKHIQVKLDKLNNGN